MVEYSTDEEKLFNAGRRNKKYSQESLEFL